MTAVERGDVTAYTTPMNDDESPGLGLDLPEIAPKPATAPASPARLLCGPVLFTVSKPGAACNPDR